MQDLKDGCNIQRCPLQDWEEASQTVLRDLKDFENTLIQLNQVTNGFTMKLDSNLNDAKLPEQTHQHTAVHILNETFTLTFKRQWRS